MPDSRPPPSYEPYFDFGEACELEAERRKPLVELIPYDDAELLGDVLDLDAAIGLDCFGPLDDEPDTERPSAPGFARGAA